MPPPIHSRFISESKARLGKCITFGLSQPLHFANTAHILRSLTRNWRKLIVGREGYITDPARAGLARHRIAWGDHDQMGHVNNVVYNFWAETARINWARGFAMRVEDDAAKKAMWEDLLTPRGIGLILRSIKTEYKFPLQYPDRVTVIHRLLQKPKEGMDSLHLEAVILSETHQRIAAKITEDIAVYDYRIRKKAPLPDFMIETLLKEYEEQERNAQSARHDTSVVEGQIRKIELETWDKEDAVEDLGSAGTSTAAVETEQEASAEKKMSKEKDTSSKADTTSRRRVKVTEGDETPLEFQVNQSGRPPSRKVNMAVKRVQI